MGGSGFEGMNSSHLFIFFRGRGGGGRETATNHLLQIQYPDPVLLFSKCIDREYSTGPSQNREAQETEATETKVSHVSNSCFVLYK